MNIAILIGRLTRDPELRYLPNTGTPICRFTLAIDRSLSKEKKQELEDEGKQTADFISVSAWGKQGEHCANYLEKGRLVAVQGRIQTGSYEKDGRRVYTTEVVAQRVKFLEWGDKGRGNDSDNSDWDDVMDGFIPVDDENIPF